MRAALLALWTFGRIETDAQGVKKDWVSDNLQEGYGDRQPSRASISTDVKCVPHDLKSPVCFVDEIPTNQLLNLAILTVQDLESADRTVMPNPLFPNLPIPLVLVLLNSSRWAQVKAVGRHHASDIGVLFCVCLRSQHTQHWVWRTTRTLPGPEEAQDNTRTT
ncbi:uncharacterized protein BDZ83DRAFT_656766 [Colletotrichum acutatum]|uniref:Uncharacterized protein n=1 Tax=Glomerella acutata TaxID=27357 RepID=A0AAD8U819_GLOAC|nr:uncharacterized protein BDZ83DRAFT_656766 [Colletotrichum acutatum]KAK1711638.1 hypothetical protein BDZ83DRAFT_656766 [Colletotrichum acutatum]